jgi:membrane-bound ClpP family serine protease
MVIDPNLIYVVLIGALWLIAAAIYMPGTGVIEGLAVLACVGAGLAMLELPTDWRIVVVVVMGGILFLVMPFIDPRLTQLALIGLALQALGSLALFRGISVSLPLILLTTGASLFYHRFALMPVLARQKDHPAMREDHSIIGARGYVQRAINPVGTVYVWGESWTARGDQPLESGTPIVVVDREGLTLFVERDKQKRPAALEEGQ